MPKLPVVRGRQLIRARQRDGWVIERVTAHVLMRHPGRPGALIPIPNHPSEAIPSGTLNSMLKQAGLFPDRLRELLYGADSMRYTVVLVPEERKTGRYVAYVPAIPGCVTYGASIPDALAMAEDAATAKVVSMADHDEDLPIEPDGAIIASIGVTAPVPAGAAA